VRWALGMDCVLGKRPRMGPVMRGGPGQHPWHFTHLLPNRVPPPLRLSRSGLDAKDLGQALETLTKLRCLG
jgi:hypothetical protein